MHTSSLNTQKRLILAGAVLLVFLVSANIAWLNPWPDKESFRGIDSVPFMWQYNKAAGVEILSGAFFPGTFRTYTDRINRPTYPLAVNLLGRIIGFAVSPVVDLSPLERAGAGYVILKLLVFYLGAAATFRVLERWMDSGAALFGTLLTLFHAHSMEYAATFQTTELQVFTPVFIIWMALRIIDCEKSCRGEASTTSWRPAALGLRHLLRIVLWSIVVGVLMLAKQNYAVYLAVLLFAAYKGRWLDAGVSVLAHLFPLLVYLLFLRVVHIPYINHEAADYGQGVWMLDLFRQNPILSLTQVLSSLWRMMVHLTGFFTVWLLVAAGALARRREIGLQRDHLVFIGLLFFGTWLQLFAAARYYDYMVSDVAILIFGLSGWVAYRWIGTPRVRSFILAIWFAGNVLSFVHFPYVPPYLQPARSTEVLENRLEMVENPDTYTDAERAQSHGGVILAPINTEENE